jgi:hypothetical protein
VSDEPEGGGESTEPAALIRAKLAFDYEVTSVIGDRLGERRRDPDGARRITIIDLTDQDRAAIAEITDRLGISEWVRLEQADPDHLAAWEQLRDELIRLRAIEPGVLSSWPMPEPGYRRPPVSIRLRAHAETVAAELHTRFGEFVELQVGALPYPAKVDEPPPTWTSEAVADRTTVSPTRARFALETPLSVPSGHTVTHPLLVANVSNQTIRIPTNGRLTAVVIDDSGNAVGGFSGAQRLPLRWFTAEPGATVRVPLLVGTASFAAALGFTLPTGDWQLVVPMTLGDDTTHRAGREQLTPALPFTIAG